MTFREIDEQITSLIDPETGEILDVEAFQNLHMERQAKAENMALWVLDLEDEVTAICGEIKRLTARKMRANALIKRLRTYLPIVLDGERMKSPRVTVSYRQTTSVDLTDEEAVIKWVQTNNLDDECLHYEEPTVVKTAIRKLTEEGKKIPGAAVVTNTSTIIK